MALYTAEGTLVGTYEYDPYGKLISVTKNPAYDDTDGILAKNPFRYRGYYYDSETGWYYLQSRYYDPEVKRFINADSTDLITCDYMNMMQYNLFMYCNGDPVNNKDENGHSALALPAEWAASMSWLIFADGPAPVGDAVYVIGALALGAYVLPEAINDISEYIKENKHTKTGDYEEDWLNDESPTKEKIGKPKGKTPPSNKKQNDDFDRALKEKDVNPNTDKGRSIHDHISGEGYDYDELLEEIETFLMRK